MSATKQHKETLEQCTTFLPKLSTTLKTLWMAVWMPLLLEKDSILSFNTCIQLVFVVFVTRNAKVVFSARVIIRKLRHASILLCYKVQRA